MRRYEGADNHSVFIIDDDNAIRSYLTAILRTEGFKVVGEAGAIEKAEKQLALHPATVVLLDINLPAQDGLTALSKLRVTYPNACFIMISGEATAGNVQAAIAEGARGFVAKPFTITKVSQALARALKL